MIQCPQCHQTFDPTCGLNDKWVSGYDFLICYDCLRRMQAADQALISNIAVITRADDLLTHIAELQAFYDEHHQDPYKTVTSTKLIINPNGTGD